MASYADTILDFPLLAENWDSYGGRPITQAAVATALRLGEVFTRHAVTLPWPVPYSDGGIQVEWHAPELEAEITIGPTGAVTGFAADGDPDRLRALVAALADYHAAGEGATDG